MAGNGKVGNGNLATDFLNNLPTGLKYTLAIIIQIAVLVLNRSHIDPSDYSTVKLDNLAFKLKRIYVAEMWTNLGTRTLVEIILIFALGYTLKYMINHIKEDT